MSDKLIFAEEVIQLVKDWGRIRGREGAAEYFVYALREKIPAVDAVEVVRCGKCFYHKDSCFAGEGNIYCDVHMKYFSKDGFCSSGERREK